MELKLTAALAAVYLQRKLNRQILLEVADLSKEEEIAAKRDKRLSKEKCTKKFWKNLNLKRCSTGYIILVTSTKYSQILPLDRLNRILRIVI